MRSASFVLLVLAACVAPPPALSQQRAPAAVAGADAGDDGDGVARGKSGFGQIMSVLTGVLQEAAARESSDRSSAASGLLSADESAVTITVTPVAGRRTLVVDRRAVDGTRSRSVAAETIDAGVTPRGAEMAMQAEGDVPD